MIVTNVPLWWGDVDSGGGCGWAGRKNMVNLAFSAQFCCESETALKK